MHNGELSTMLNNSIEQQNLTIVLHKIDLNKKYAIISVIRWKSRLCAISAYLYRGMIIVLSMMYDKE